MMALVNTRQLALLAWALVNATLVIAIGGELDWGENLHPILPAPVLHPSAPVKIVLPPDYHLPVREKVYARTLERPLFVPTRRPAPPPPPPPPPTMQKGQFQLLGTTITDDFSIAIIKEISSGKVRQVFQGYTINGLQLDLVEPNRIVFSQYGDKEEIRLKIQPSPKPVSTPQGEQPAKLQGAPAAPRQPELPATWTRGQGASAGQIGKPASIPPPPQPPQTMEDRKLNPLMKDFYKK